MSSPVPPGHTPDKTLCLLCCLPCASSCCAGYCTHIHETVLPLTDELELGDSAACAAMVV